MDGLLTGLIAALGQVCLGICILLGCLTLADAAILIRVGSGTQQEQEQDYRRLQDLVLHEGATTKALRHLDRQCRQLLSSPEPKKKRPL